MTRAYMGNTWDFFGSETDQGLLFFTFYYATDIGRPFELRPKSVHSSRCAAGGNVTEEGLKGLCPHMGRHFLGRVKPWALERGWGAGSKGGPEKLGRYQNLGRVAGYLRSVNYQPLVNRSKCAARFAEMAKQPVLAAQIAATEKRGEIAEPGGHFQQVR